MVESYLPVPEKEYISFDELRWNLPLFEDLFLSMQGQNIMLVDFYLCDLERDLLSRWVEIERTPPETMLVSALSQMWIFAAYELLRTWRQRIKDLKRDSQKAPTASTAASRHAGFFYQQQLTKFRTNAKYRSELDRASTRIEPLFRRIEALRMNLAKHEVPKMSIPAMAPGYGRIDGMNGSISWQIDLGNNTVDLVSRRSLSDNLRKLVIKKTRR